MLSRGKYRIESVRTSVCSSGLSAVFLYKKQFFNLLDRLVSADYCFHVPMVDEIQKLLHAEPFMPFSITTDDGTARPVQSRDHALIGRTHLVLLDSFRNIELINRRKITSVSIKEEGWER
jgi:hypothetical protein